MKIITLIIHIHNDSKKKKKHFFSVMNQCNHCTALPANPTTLSSGRVPSIFIFTWYLRPCLVSLIPVCAPSSVITRNTLMCYTCVSLRLFLSPPSSPPAHLPAHLICRDSTGLASLFLCVQSSGVPTRVSRGVDLKDLLDLLYLCPSESFTLNRTEWTMSVQSIDDRNKKK